MKRVYLVLVFTVLLFFYACIPMTISPPIHTAVAQTQTATMWTPTATSTIHPDVSEILSLLNDGLPKDNLEMAIDARYSVVDAWFPFLSNSSFKIFHIDIRCECVINSQCCTPQHMYVLAMRALKHRAEDIIAQVPGDVIRVDVACYNSSTPIGVLSASWVEVKEYIRGNFDGHILGWHVTPNPAP
jgi:hypothetical protein